MRVAQFLLSISDTHDCMECGVRASLYISLFGTLFSLSRSLTFSSTSASSSSSISNGIDFFVCYIHIHGCCMVHMYKCVFADELRRLIDVCVVSMVIIANVISVMCQYN